MAIQGEDIKFIGTQSYSSATGSNKINGAIYFTDDENGSIVVNGKVYGTTNSDLMSTPTSGSLKQYIDDVATGAADGSTGALTSAKQYTDEKIGALDKTDVANSGQYVSAVSQADGKITVSREELPTITVSQSGTSTNPSDIYPIISISADGHLITYTTPSTPLATKDYVNDFVSSEISNLVNGAPDAFDTLKEIADWINGDGVNATELSDSIAKTVKSVSATNTWTNSKTDTMMYTYLTYTLSSGTTYNFSLEIPYAVSSTPGVVTPGEYLQMENESSKINFNSSSFIDDHKASKSKLGFVQVGKGITVDTNGVISVEIDQVEGTIESSTYTTNLYGGNANYLVYQTATNKTGFIASGTNGQVLKMVNGIPAWSADINNYNKVGVAASTSGVTYLVSSTSNDEDKTLNYSSKVYVNNANGALYATYLYENGTSLSNIYLKQSDYTTSSNIINQNITNITNDIINLIAYIDALDADVADIKTYLQWQ